MLAFIRDGVYNLPLPDHWQETLLEVLRIAVLAAISAFITAILRYFNIIGPEQTLDSVSTITVIGKILDAFKYEQNKTKGVSGENNFGLLGF